MYLKFDIKIRQLRIYGQDFSNHIKEILSTFFRKNILKMGVVISYSSKLIDPLANQHYQYYVS